MMYPTKDKPEMELGATEDAFLSAYKKLPPTPKGTIRLFERTDYYSAHGHDALYVAEHVYRTTTVLKHLGRAPKSPYCTLSRPTAVAFLRDALTAKSLRVEIYTSPTAPNQWTLTQQASPGNLGQVEELLFGSGVGGDLLSAPVILALTVKEKEGKKTVGVAFADTSLAKMGVAQFDDNDLFSNTESLLIQLGVKEVLLPSDEKSADYDLAKIRVVVERCGIVITDRKKNEFMIKDVEQDLNRLLKSELQVATLPEFDLKVAMASTSALISYLSLINDTTNHARYTLEAYDLSQYMKLDASALRALNLMPDPTGMGGSSKNMSLYGLLNRCKTAQGMRLLNRWLKQPLVNLHEIERRQDLVECMIVDTDLRHSISDNYLKAMPDLHRIAKRFQKGAANLEDVVRVYQCVTKLPEMITALEGGGADNAEWKELIQEVWLDLLKEFATSLNPLQQMVETTINFDEADRHNYVIKPEFDDELMGIKTQQEQVIVDLNEQHESVARDLDMEMSGKTPLHFEVHQTYGYCFRLTRKEAKPIKEKSKYIELINKSNGVSFTTAKLKTINIDNKQLTIAYEKKQKDLVKEVIAIASSYGSVLERLNDVLANVDVIVSFATAALNAPIPYVKPVVSERGVGKVSLVDSRHPCLEVQEGINFIPNDLTFERDVDEFHVITGANMGGKSTYIRQVGVIALLAQIGSFVPCTSAALPIFDSILCRVGAGDSQLKGVSTFMAEMLETATILSSATRDSLIIIDELGRGTSTYDGFGLAWAISEHIATEIRAYCLFATHFHELTTLVDKISHVKNYHVMAHVEEKSDSITGKEITFLYQIMEGVCDQSFGIHVAQLANFPEEVIKLAKRKADDLEDFTDTPTEANLSTTISPALTAAGTKLTETMLLTWAQSASDTLDSTTTETEVKIEEANDIVMEGTAGEWILSKELARECELLRSCLGGFENELEGSEWAKVVLSQTY